MAIRQTKSRIYLVNRTRGTTKTLQKATTNHVSGFFIGYNLHITCTLQSFTTIAIELKTTGSVQVIFIFIWLI